MNISLGRIILVIAVITGILFFVNSIPAFQNNSGRTSVDTVNANDLPSSIPKISSQRSLYVDKRLQNKPIPTNKMWSAIPFSGSLNTLFLYPLAVKMVNGEMVVSNPQNVVNEKSVIANTAQNAINLRFSQPINNVELYDFSDITVTVVGYSESKVPLFKATFVQGSPYIYFDEITNGVDVYSSNLNFSSEKKRWEGERAYFELTGATKSVQKDNINILKPDSSRFTLAFYSKADVQAEVMDYALNVITAGKAEFSVENNNAITRYTFAFASNKSEKTFFGLLPNHSRYSTATPSFSISTLRGEQKMVTIESGITSSQPLFNLQENLPFQGSSQDKQLILDTIKGDADATSSSPVGSYFGAKYLARNARLIQIAEAIGADDIKQDLIFKLRIDLQNWFSYQKNEEAKYFVYDDTVGSLIAQKAEFGSENYNDHHFHYGYFIYAAAVLAEQDKEFLADYKDTINLIIADIALSNKKDAAFSSLFPTMRAFDFYEGHSWASGTAPFLDGNNQESTSEALNAWYAIWLWGTVTESSEYKEIGNYLFSTELNSTRNYWFADPSTNYSFPDGYKNSIASIVWGGKVDFATWFSAQPLDIYGIQFIPFTPASVYLQNSELLNRDKDILENALNNREGKLQDIVLMYLGVNGGRKNMSKDMINSVLIDDGNSRTNLLFWLMYNEKE